MTFHSRVEFAHIDNTVDEDDPLHHGKGSIMIETDVKITTQAQKDEIARTIGLRLNKTAIAIMAIIPQETGKLQIDAGSDG